MSLSELVRKSWEIATFPLEETKLGQSVFQSKLGRLASSTILKSLFKTKPYHYLAHSALGKKLPAIKDRTKTIALRAAGQTVNLFGSLALLAYCGHYEQYTEIRAVKKQPLPAIINVVTYNLAMGEGGPFEWTKSLFKSPLTEYSAKGIEGIAQVLREENAHIACLNEIGISGVRGEHQPNIFAEKTPLKSYLFGSGVTFLASYWNPFAGMRHDFLANGNAIMTAAQIIDSTHIRSLETFKPATISTFNDWLVGTEGLLHAAINYNGNRINVYCNHFSSEEFRTFPWIKQERDRVTEAKILASIVSSPAIIAGDLNTVPLPSRDFTFGDDGKKYQDEETLIVLEHELKKKGLVLGYALKEMMNLGAVKIYEGTYIGRVPIDDLGKRFTVKEKSQRRKHERIDYVLVVNNPNSMIQLKIISDKVKCLRLNSDHCPVVAEIGVSYQIRNETGRNTAQDRTKNTSQDY